ncbi:MAG: Ig-like domain-containing protein [Candidatus Aegiribacteria sp.]|nr:Ig-like domain-containing protein [Candidatus Aegiribacteria sp.]
MKRIIVGISLSLLLLLGCAKDNPFKADPEVQREGGNEHPHIDMAGTESGGFGNFQFSDLDPEKDGIQDAVILSFDKEIDPSTITAASFEMVETDPGAGSIQFTNISYYPEIRTAILAGTFSDDTAYLLTVNAGSILDIVGNELDPNHNALYDGSPWDDRLFAFFNGSAEIRDITPPGISGNFPNTGNVGNLLPQPRVLFNNGPMDEDQLTLNNFTMVRTADSSSVILEILSVTSTGITTEPKDSLSYGTRYTLRLSAQIADSAGNYLDTNGDGYVWPNEPDLVWDFQIVDDSTTHAAPPSVDQATLMSGNAQVYIEFEQSLTGDDVVMDDGTFTAANIQVIDNNGSIPIVFETSVDPSAVNCLLQRNAEGTVTLFVSYRVADEYGNLLDGNHDGLGGNPEEDDWSGIL